MRIEVTTDLSGFQDLLNVKDADVRKALAGAVNSAARKGLDDIVKNTPVKFGVLRNSISRTLATADVIEAEIYSNTEYAPMVEFGTGVYSEAPGSRRAPIVIYAKTFRYRVGKGGKVQSKPVRLLCFKNSQGNWVSAQAVVIAGQRPKAMFRKAIPLIEAVLAQEIGNIIERLGKK
jgi:hypothetical protein